MDPTSYHIDTITCGVVASRTAITRRPLASVRSLNWIAGTWVVPLAGAGCAVRAFDFRENDHSSEPEGEPCPILAPYAGRGDAKLFLDDPAPEIQW